MKVITGIHKKANRSRTRGWVVGCFADDTAKTKAVEIKLWEYGGPITYHYKIFHGHEFIVIDGGSIAIIVRDNGHTKRYVLEAEKRSWILLPPGTKRRVEVLRGPTWGTTVRWPSVPS